MQIPPQQPHRHGPLHQTNKLHKGGRHEKRSSVTNALGIKSLVKPVSRVKREDRLNQAGQSRKLKRERVIEEKRKLGTENHPPLNVGVLNISNNSCKAFFKGIESQDDTVLKARKINDRSLYVLSNRLRMRFRLIALDATNFDETIDIIKSLDFLILLNSVDHIDEYDNYCASKLNRAITIHCLPTIIHVVEDNSLDKDTSSSKKFLNAKRILRSKIKDDKIHCIERPQDYQQLLHILGNSKRLRSQFKEARSTIVPDNVELEDNSLTFTGFVRKRILSPNDLIHITGYGDYQIKQIDVLPDIVALRPTSVESPKVVQTLLPDPMQQETLEQENEIDPMEGEQTWPTADELAAEVERRNTKKVVKKLPPGTSEYQGAWIPEDSDGDYSDVSSDEDGDTTMKEIMEDDVDDDEESQSEDEMELQQSGTNDDRESIMDVEDYDKSHSRDKEQKILGKLREARLDEMFPDEIDTPADTPARVRFAKYRGLKSFRTSQWDPQENLPPDYSKIFQFQNFQHTKRRVLSDLPTEGVNPGQYVRVHLKDVSGEIAADILKKSVLPTLFGLLKYERKMTVMNILIKRLSDSTTSYPIKSKDELIFYVGFRKFKARPLFTAHSASPKFKYERFLRDDIAMVATVYSPITFPPAPVLVFREGYKGEKDLVASGSVLDANPSRLIIKRIRLSGHPFKIHSKSAVIRFMFFNGEDVTYFKPVELTSKYNRRGHITEPLGTHGHMKCLFDKRIRSDDCVFMNLYKRVFPKWIYLPIYDL
ncbi:hypothetical protein SUGI_1493260 [Cryptomeria japonica]|uniref:Bms1-type G domain-containing protein n=1 Tax=Cryptomeria japonica TaxID=3369 RepID=A0AAD3RRN1_CRYJA|nr:uncharacterized protein LOC131872745 [Cryptomeria japonica]GLJ59124.1 hypothetical protein SUGI_1493260 [Cryptomeria japonica]